MKKSTIKIPVRKSDGSVPHWINSQQYCEQEVSRLKAELAEGYDKSGRCGWLRNEKDWRSYLTQCIVGYDFDWREPWEFTETFQITGYGRGRSAAYFDLESSCGTTCIMFMSDFTDMLLKYTIVSGRITGHWKFVKKGQNFGVQFLGEV